MKQTPKDKAEELVYKFMDKRISWKQSKLCVLISVDEIINSTPSEPNFADWDDCGGEHRYFYDAQKTHAHHYWQEVKQELEKL
jgi:hypothetical protein